MASNIVYIAIQGGATSAADTNKSWNNVTTQTQTLTNMVDEDGSATVFDFAPSDPAIGEATNGVNAVGSGDAAWVDEAIISKESHWNTEAADDVDFQFSGLDDAKTYSFEFFGSRDGSGTRRLEISVDNFSTTEDTINCYGNSTLTAKATGISPVSNSIIVTWRTAGTDDFAYVNAIKMTEDIAAGANPKGPLGMPLMGALGGPI